MKKKLFILIFGIILISHLTANISALNNSDNICAVYFTSLNCPNCAATDPAVLKNWLDNHDDFVVIEYVFSSWNEKNAKLLGEYAGKYATMPAVPNLFINGKNGVGRIEILNLENEITSGRDASCSLLDVSISFENLNLNELPANPKIWVKDKVLIKLKEGDVENDFLKEILFSENLDQVLTNSHYDIQRIPPMSMPISRGEIYFKNAVQIKDNWVLVFNDETTISEPIVNNINDTANDALIKIPIFGFLDTKNGSLLILTILIGLADGFNPCAFFILTFLLAAMLYATSEEQDSSKKRKKILIVGGIFVLFSALIYFLFMGLWLNVFLFAKEIMFLTFVAGLIAIFAGIINIKDYFFFQKSLSFTLPKKEKSKFVQKVEKLVKVKTTWALILGTIIIAMSVNMYELLCTFGFPMVYLRILTLREMTGLSHYFYLALYNLVYIIPLAIIVGVFAYTLGSKEFSKQNVQRLKLVSGFMVLFLGFVLIFNPNLLENVLISFGLLFGAVLMALIIMFFWEFLSPKINNNSPEKNKSQEL